MVDLISQEYDIVARYQGGNNAGHTVKNERGTFVLHLDDAVKKRLITMVDAKNLVMEGSYNADPISVDEMLSLIHI